MRVMGNEAVPTSDLVGVSAETEQWVLPPFPGLPLRRWLSLGLGLGQNQEAAVGLIEEPASGRGFCDPRLGPWFYINCLSDSMEHGESPAWR